MVACLVTRGGGCCTDRASGAPASLSRSSRLLKMETGKHLRVSALTREVGGAAAEFLGFFSAWLSDRGGASQMETSEKFLSYSLFVR